MSASQVCVHVCVCVCDCRFLRAQASPSSSCRSVLLVFGGVFLFFFSLQKEDANLFASMQSKSIKTRQKHQATVLELHLSNHIISVYPLCLKNVSQIESVFVKSSTENWLQTVLLLLWFQHPSTPLYFSPTKNLFFFCRILFGNPSKCKKPKCIKHLHFNSNLCLQN